MRRPVVLSAWIACAVIGLRAQTPPRAAEPTCTPFNAGGIYALGDRVGWTIARPLEGALAGTQYAYVITKNNAVPVKSGTFDLSAGPAIIEAAIDEPSMVYAQITDASAAAAKPISLGAAVAPWKLLPSAPRPADFDAFWDGKLKALAAVPTNPMLTPSQTSIPGIALSTVTLDSLGSHVQGYLAAPSRPGKFPALVIYQYAGVYALNTRTVTDRAVEGWLALDVSSHDMPPDQATAPRDYQAIGNTDRESSYFLNMYLRDARAIDYITSRPDWDGRTLVAMGTSMGGQQSLVTAGLRRQITAVLVNEPSGTDANGDLHGRKPGYPNWPSANPDVMRTALYFDPVNFAPRITAPTAAAIGFIDTIAPPAGIWTALNQIPGAKEAIPMIESDHNNLTPQKQGAWETRWREVLAAAVRGDAFQANGIWTRR